MLLSQRTTRCGHGHVRCHPTSVQDGELLAMFVSLHFQSEVGAEPLGDGNLNDTTYTGEIHSRATNTYVTPATHGRATSARWSSAQPAACRPLTTTRGALRDLHYPTLNTRQYMQWLVRASNSVVSKMVGRSGPKGSGGGAPGQGTTQKSVLQSRISRAELQYILLGPRRTLTMSRTYLSSALQIRCRTHCRTVQNPCRTLAEPSADSAGGSARV